MAWRFGPLGVFGVLVVACGGANGKEAATAPPAASEPAPLATVEKIDRDALKSLVKTAPGRPLFVNFWATWCGPCVAEMPEFIAFAAEHPEARVVLVNLDFPTLTQTHVVPFVERHGLRGVDVVQIDDADPADAVSWAVPEWTSAIPYTIVFAPDGTPVARHGVAIDRSKLERGLELALEPR